MKKSQKAVKLFLATIFALALLFTPFQSVSAKSIESSDNNTFNTSKGIYNSLVKEGVLGADVTYDTWVQAVKENESGFERLMDNQVTTQKTSSNKSSTGITTNASTYQDWSTIDLEPGDFLVTTSTSNYGIQGHAGIVIPDGRILHIPGDNSPVLLYSLDQWMSHYPSTAVYREPNRTIANEAASWAYQNYYVTNKWPFYVINTEIYKTDDPTYCSKIVWQAYYFGTGSAQVETVPSTHIAYPYNLEDYFTSAYYPYVVWENL